MPIPPQDRKPTRRGGEPPPRKNPLPGGNEAFTCLRCGAAVRPLQNGSIRNHCPECLWSLHVDRVPGDRAEACGGLMRPAGLAGGVSSGWTIEFRCESCGAMKRNRAAPDDPEQPDRWDLLVELSSRAPSRTGGFSRSGRGGRTPDKESDP